MFEKSCFLVESILDCKVTNILSLIDRKDVIFFEPFKHIQERTSYSLIQRPKLHSLLRPILPKDALYNHSKKTHFGFAEL